MSNIKISEAELEEEVRSVKKKSILFWKEVLDYYIQNPNRRPDTGYLIDKKGRESPIHRYLRMEYKNKFKKNYDISDLADELGLYMSEMMIPSTPFVMDEIWFFLELAVFDKAFWTETGLSKKGLHFYKSFLPMFFEEHSDKVIEFAIHKLAKQKEVRDEASI